MELWLAAAFLLIITALYFGLKPDLKGIEDLLLGKRKKLTLKKMAGQKESRFRIFIRNTLSMMKETDQSGKFYVLIVSSLFLLVIGAAAGLAVNNYFLVPVLALGFASLPFVYIRFQYIKYYKLMIEELEVTLSTISLSYERTENILSAVEENLDNIHPPIKKIFTDFVFTLKYVNPNMDFAIEEMKHKIDHSVFKEWCDALKRCSRDRSLKYILRPIVNKLKEIKKASGKQQNILYGAIQNFWALIAATVAMVFVCLYLLPKGFNVTIPAILSDILIAVTALLILTTGIAVSFISRDIKFDI